MTLHVVMTLFDLRSDGKHTRFCGREQSLSLVEKSWAENQLCQSHSTPSIGFEGFLSCAITTDLTNYGAGYKRPAVVSSIRSPEAAEAQQMRVPGSHPHGRSRIRASAWLAGSFACHLRAECITLTIASLII